MTLQSFLWRLFRPLLVMCALVGVTVWVTSVPLGAWTPPIPVEEVVPEPPPSVTDERPKLAPPPIDPMVYRRLKQLCTIQHTDQGRHLLAELFFKRLLTHRSQAGMLRQSLLNYLSEEFKAQRFRQDKRKVDAEFVRSQTPLLKNDLLLWYFQIGIYIPLNERSFANPEAIDQDKFNAAADRVAELVRKGYRCTAAENTDVTRLMVRGGSDWLKVPFDEGAGRFNPDGKWAPDSPEVALSLYKQLFRECSGKEWSQVSPVREDVP